MEKIQLKREPQEETLALSKIEAARHLRISARWLEVLTREGKIPCVALSFGERKRYIYSREVLTEWLRGRSQKGQEQGKQAEQSR